MYSTSSRSFTSVPNFRLVDRELNDKHKPKLYRSSRPDFITDGELEDFKSLGIRCIIDFRSPTEYRKASGTKLLDSHYPVYRVKFRKFGFGRVPLGQKFELEQLRIRADQSMIEPQYVGRHYLINFYLLNYVFVVFRRAPIWFRIYSIFILFIDVILNTGFVYFVRAFAKRVLNKAGLLGQYIDMLTLSQEPIRAALTLLTDKDNVPALINCAHGKDRTGIVSALVLSCLGKSREYIAKNYAQSAVELEFMKERLHNEIVGKLHMCSTFTTANERTMLDLLDYIDGKYGSVSKYLEHIGFTIDQQELLRQNLSY